MAWQAEFERNEQIVSNVHCFWHVPFKTGSTDIPASADLVGRSRILDISLLAGMMFVPATVFPACV